MHVELAQLNQLILMLGALCLVSSLVGAMLGGVISWLLEKHGTRRTERPAAKIVGGTR